MYNNTQAKTMVSLGLVWACCPGRVKPIKGPKRNLPF